jgi:hypothetical protein
MPDASLMSFFKFNEADLSANKAGRFSAAQQERLKHQDKWKRGGSLGGGVVALIVALASLIFAIIFLVNNHDPESGPEMGIAFGIVVPLVFGFFGVRNLWKAFGPREMRVANVQGPASIAIRKWRDEQGVEFSHAELRIGGRKFLQTTGLPNAMSNGKEYRVYYVRDTDTILSAEALGNAM